MINKTNIMHFQALLLQIMAVINNTYTSGLEQIQYTIYTINMESFVTLDGNRDPHLSEA
jgi:hypothetical protein